MKSNTYIMTKTYDHLSIKQNNRLKEYEKSIAKSKENLDQR